MKRLTLSYLLNLYFTYFILKIHYIRALFIKCAMGSYDAECKVTITYMYWQELYLISSSNNGLFISWYNNFILVIKNIGIFILLLRVHTH